MVGRRPTTKWGAQRLLHRCHAHDGREECGGGDGEHAVAGGADAVDAKKEYEQVEMDGSWRGSDAGVKNAHFIDIKKLGSLMSGFFLHIIGCTSGSTGNPNSLKGVTIKSVITSGRMDTSHSYDFDKDGKCPQLDFPE